MVTKSWVLQWSRHYVNVLEQLYATVFGIVEPLPGRRLQISDARSLTLASHTRSRNDPKTLTLATWVFPTYFADLEFHSLTFLSIFVHAWFDTHPTFQFKAVLHCFGSLVSKISSQSWSYLHDLGSSALLCARWSVVEASAHVFVLFMLDLSWSCLCDLPSIGFDWCIHATW